MRDKNPLYSAKAFSEYNIREAVERLDFVRDCGCQDVIFTGEGEPTENMAYILWICNINRNHLRSHPFRKLELQTNGTNLTPDNLAQLQTYGIKTISLSLSSFNDEENAEINQTAHGSEIKIKAVCAQIVAAGFNLRISLNMNSYGEYSPFKYGFDSLIEMAGVLGAAELTLRKLYESGDAAGERQNAWVKVFGSPGPGSWAAQENWAELYTQAYAEKGKAVRLLPFGAILYNVNGVNVVVDGDCMAQEAKQELKYAVLRPNLRLYARWDVPSLIF
jgi:hypothetical protein